MKSLENMSILITGGGSGIGLGAARYCIERGAKVTICGRREDKIETAAAELGGSCFGVAADITIAAHRQKLLESAISHGGQLDALVNNAGISPKGPEGERLDTFDTDLRTWGHVFHVNFFAPVVLARSLRDELAAAKGAVVNVTSIAGGRVHPFAGAAYATSKAALPGTVGVP